ncbi:MAG: hypothetical protein Q8M76_04780, partial [Spirochaetaceae bacterium]|nr:hypothetical protein [Spirochaetaceae bacterium]
PAGYYELRITHTAGSELLRSPTEAVRIAADQSSRGTFRAFYDILLGETGEARIEFGEAPLLEVAANVSGPEGAVLSGTQVTLSASADRIATGYSWYVNKVLVESATAAELDLGTTLAVGDYRVDVVVSTDHGPGAASCVFSVEQTMALTEVAQGKLLVNAVDPSRWSYVYRTTGSNLFSMQSSNAG